MFKENDPILRPSPEETTLSSERQPLPTQDNLATQMLQVLERIPETGKTYNIREATQVLNQAASEADTETSISRTTLQKWVTISLAGIIKKIEPLSQKQLTSAAFSQHFPNEETLPFSPSALRSFAGTKYFSSLELDDLRGVLSSAQEAYEKGLDSEYHSAKELTKRFQNGCLALREIAMILDYRYPDSEFLRRLDQLILNETLPLNNYPRILARTVGIPKRFFIQELRKEWQKVLLQAERKRKTERKPRYLLRYYPEKFLSLNRFLRPRLKAEGIKLQTKYLPLLTIYFEEKNIEIRSAYHKHTSGFYHCLSPENQEEIERLLENEETRGEIRRIANQGFTLKEYTETYRHHFPDGTPIALTEAIRLASGLKTFSFRKRIKRIKELLIQNKIPLKEKTLIWKGEKKVLTYLLIEHLTSAVDILEKASAIDPTLFKSIKALYLGGKASSLTLLLRKALPEERIATIYLPLIYEQHLADIDGIYRKKIRTKRGKDYYSYFALNAKHQETVGEIQERRKGIVQTIEEAKKSTA